MSTMTTISVEEVQNSLVSLAGREAWPEITTRTVQDLAARVADLRDLGPEFDGVGLSRHVVDAAAVSMSSRMRRVGA